MCGIVGVYSLKKNVFEYQESVSDALNALSRRGPDAAEVYWSGNVGLGHRRLAIIDINKHANQPMQDQSGRYCLVFNGEIFNYKTLKADLEAKGIIFKTQSDTEVLLQMYIMYKEKCLDLIQGFFAFAVYDNLNNDLLIAKDPLGKKPLYYFKNEEYFIFGSELKSLQAFGFEKKINMNSLFFYLQLNYIPGEDSIYENVKRLKPGHYIKFNSSKELTITRYFNLTTEIKSSSSLNYEQAKKELFSKLEKSVQTRLVSDVPLGCFLSGGIDSSITTFLASREIKNLKTFSVGYKDEPFFDETPFALAVSKKCKTDHTVFSLSNSDLYDSLFEVLDYLDEPFADSSALAVYILSKNTRKHIKVALSGDGADEIFSGYNKHQAEYGFNHPNWKSKTISALSPLWKALPKSRNNTLFNKFRQFDKFASLSKYSPKERYWKMCCISNDKEMLSILTPKLRNEFNPNHNEKFLTHYEKSSDINTFLLSDTELVLPYDMLFKTDMMSMANGLELRSPFLDVSVVNFANSLAPDFKINAQMRKRIVQDTFKEHLPNELYQRPKKGFEVPLLSWLKNELDSLIRKELLSEEFVREQGIFDYPAIKSLIDKLHSQDPEDSHARVWGLIVFQYWYKKYFLS